MVLSLFISIIIKLGLAELLKTSQWTKANLEVVSIVLIVNTKCVMFGPTIFFCTTKRDVYLWNRVSRVLCQRFVNGNMKWCIGLPQSP